MATYEVSLVIDGMAGEVETHRNEGAAYAAADRLAEEAKDVADKQIKWNVYVTPHYCRPDEDECMCVSWMPDHRPYRSGKGVQPERGTS